MKKFNISYIEGTVDELEDHLRAAAKLIEPHQNIVNFYLYKTPVANLFAFTLKDSEHNMLGQLGMKYFKTLAVINNATLHIVSSGRKDY